MATTLCNAPTFLQATSFVKTLIKRGKVDKGRKQGIFRLMIEEAVKMKIIVNLYAPLQNSMLNKKANKKVSQTN